MITGFVGVGLFDTVVGYQRRLLSDVLFLNSKNDLACCEGVCRELGIKHEGLVVSGLPFVGAVPDVGWGDGAIEAVVFAGQPDVPGRLVERIYLLGKMMEYARRFPERKIYFKPRHRPRERTLHRTDYHYETLMKCFFKYDSKPKNFQIVYDSLPQYLKECQLLVTMSSTAVFEALEHGVRVALVDDLGISEEYGNHYFMGSALLCSFEALYEDELPQVDRGWLVQNLRVSGNGLEVILEATEKAISTNSGNMCVPYMMEKLEAQARCRAEIKAFNKRKVRRIPAMARFFFQRTVKERRLF